MLEVVGCSLQEVVEVIGSPLEEDMLWNIAYQVLVFCSANYDTIKKKSNKITTPKTIMLLPDGKVFLNFEATDTDRIKFACLLNLEASEYKEDDRLILASLSLCLIWCAEYNLDPCLPMQISDLLQSTLTEMIENKEYQLKKLKDQCLPHIKANKLVELYNLIMGNSTIFDTSNYTSNLNNQSRNNTFLKERLDFESINDVQILGQSYSITSEHPTENSSLRSDSIENVSLKADVIGKKILSKILTISKPHKSILHHDDEEHIIRLDVSLDDSCSFSVNVIFLMRIKMKVYFRDPETTTVRKVMKCALNFLKFDTECACFSLSTYKDKEYYFLEKDSYLSKVLQPDETNLHLKIIFFPNNLSSDRNSLREAIYMQVRSDIVDECLVCSHDDMLALISLALQCEIGDYKSEYGLNYYIIEDYASKHAIDQLGVSYIRTQTSALHRQLAGIKQKEAQLLFLRRCQNLEEYGAHLYRIYKHKDCSDNERLWFGIGPLGITLYEVKRRNIRTKTETYPWKILKKFSYNSRKLVFVVNDLTTKVKFYQKTLHKAKLIVQLIIEMHRYYLSETPTSHFSSLALFENITQITTPGLSTPQFSRSSEDLLNNPSINLEVSSSQSSVASSFCGDAHGLQTPSSSGSYHKTKRLDSVDMLPSRFATLKTVKSFSKQAERFFSGFKNKSKSTFDLTEYAAESNNRITSLQDEQHIKSKIYRLLPNGDDASSSMEAEC